MNGKCDYCNAVLPLPRLTICERCEIAWNNGVASMKRSLWPNYDERMDTTPDGRNIRTTEATHRMLTRIAKEKPE